MSVGAESGRRILVAMSGGVDSSLAAALIGDSGDEVVGITMQLAGETSRCCSLEDADDARRVAERLGIRFYVANYADQFKTEVIDAFAEDYLAGRTPIPCVACNKRFKFDHLMQRADVLGAAGVATGHYARIDTDPETGARRLLRARDRSKDQTYFLFQLDQGQLARIRFPLGELTKSEVRARARELGLATADKPESQEICFVPDGDYAAVVEALRPEALTRGGDIVDESGQVLGTHAGIHRFTIGQRHGLGISASERLYVTHLDPETRTVVVGDVDALAVPAADVDAVNWISGEVPESSLRARVQVRYRHEGEPARIEILGPRRVRVHFDSPVRAVAPGQAAVFYTEDADTPDATEVLGGGWIQRGVR
jgi:tRNA-specific 2-thiouridylase